MRTIIEPFRIKMTEALPITTREDREAHLAEAGNNVFLLDADQVTIDLLTDSGTGAMSDRQWAAMVQGDESYAGSSSWRRFEQTVRKITNFKHIFPNSSGQGRGAHPGGYPIGQGKHRAQQRTFRHDTRKHRICRREGDRPAG